MNGVFYHRPDSIYDDDPARFYHFPSQYLSRVRKTVGDFIVYYGPQLGRRPSYWAIARVMGVRSDPSDANLYYADVAEYLPLDRPLGNTEQGGFERKLVRPDGSINGGRAVQAVRLIDADEFARIVETGLSEPDEWPARTEASSVGHTSVLDVEEEQASFERPIIQQLTNRPFRDRKFQQQVRRAYDRTCAFTGLRLINGFGRPEVEAAHIMPVEKNGPDTVRNGIALSGTVHWMFDRGLLSLADDYTILKSRHLNHDVSNLLRPNMKAWVPPDPQLQPHTFYLDWHRNHCFKA